MSKDLEKWDLKKFHLKKFGLKNFKKGRLKHAIGKLNCFPLNFMFLNFMFEGSRTFFHGVYALFLLEKGMSLERIANVKIFFMVAVVLLEVPSGILADTLGRRKVYLLSCALGSLSFAVYFWGRSFPFFAMAEFLYGCALALESGILSSLVMDKMEGDKTYITSVFSKINCAGVLGMFLAGNIGIIIAAENIALPWVFSATSMALTFLVAMVVLKNSDIGKKGGGFNAQRVKAIMKFAGSSFVQFPAVKIVLVVMVLYAFFSQSIFQYWQVFFRREVKVPLSHFTYLYSFMHLMTIGGSSLLSIGILCDRKLLTKIFCALLLLILPVIFMNYFRDSLYVMLLFGVSSMGRGIFDPLVQTLLSRVTPRQSRVTVISLVSGLVRLNTIFILFLIGKGVMHFGILPVWTVVSTVFLILSSLVFYLCRKQKWLMD